MSASHRSIPSAMREEGTKIHMLTATSANHLTRHQAIVEDFAYILHLRFMADAGNATGISGRDPRVRRSIDHFSHISAMSALSADEPESENVTTLLQNSISISGSGQ